MKTEHAYRMLLDIADETTETIIGADRPRIDAAREALDLPPLTMGQTVAVGLDLERARFVLEAIERGGHPESEECYDSKCPGYFAEQEDVDLAYGLQRCDACAQYSGDLEAARAYVLATWYSGYVVTAWIKAPEAEDGRCLATGSDSVNAFVFWKDSIAYADELMRMRHDEIVNGVRHERAYCSEVRIEQVGQVPA